jgi:hypothetical protein
MPAILNGNESGGGDLNFTVSGVSNAKLAATSSGIFTLSSAGGAGTVKLTGLTTPSAGADAANKQYVDNLVQGLSVRDSVRVATSPLPSLPSPSSSPSPPSSDTAHCAYFKVGVLYIRNLVGKFGNAALFVLSRLRVLHAVRCFAFGLMLTLNDNRSPGADARFDGELNPSDQA